MHMCAYLASSTPQLPAEEQVDVAVEVFRMLADATRLRLLWAMRDGEVTVRDLTDTVAKP
jgi:DNA-binding transcriptional ArsR family regulator